MNILRLTFNLFQEQCRILWTDSKDAVIVDPGYCGPQEEKQFFDSLEKNGLTPCAILLTHAHFDHIFGVYDLQKKYGIPVYMDPADKEIYSTDMKISGKMGFPAFSTDWEITPVADGQILNLAGFQFKVITTPGHSPGSVCYWCEKEEFVLTGDTLFCGTIGRTDLDGGDYDKEILSIMNKLILLPPQTVVMPGHGADSTISEERTSNPFLEPFNEREELGLD